MVPSILRQLLPGLNLRSCAQISLTGLYSGSCYGLDQNLDVHSSCWGLDQNSYNMCIVLAMAWIKTQMCIVLPCLWLKSRSHASDAFMICWIWPYWTKEQSVANICCQLSFSLKTSLDNSQADSVDVKGKVDEPKLQEIKDMRIIGARTLPNDEVCKCFQKELWYQFSQQMLCAKTFHWYIKTLLIDSTCIFRRTWRREMASTPRTKLSLSSIGRRNNWKSSVIRSQGMLRQRSSQSCRRSRMLLLLAPLKSSV